MTGPEVSPTRWTVSVRKVTSSCMEGAVCVNWSCEADPVVASLTFGTKASPNGVPTLFALWMGLTVGKSVEVVEPVT